MTAVGHHRPARGIRLWFAVLGGIAAWLVHLGFVSAFVQYTCNVHGTVWVQHAVTAVTAVITLLAMALAFEYARAGTDALDADTHSAQLRFLGLFGLIVGAINLALILLEGSYVIFLTPCHR